jgi:hypothetical protein
VTFACRKGRDGIGLPSGLFQSHLLIWPRPGVQGDQTQSRFFDPGAHDVESDELEEWREHHALLHEALQFVQQSLPPCRVSLPRLLLEEFVEVRIAPPWVNSPHDMT